MDTRIVTIEDPAGRIKKTLANIWGGERVVVFDKDDSVSAVVLGMSNGELRLGRCDFSGVELRKIDEVRPM